MNKDIVIKTILDLGFNCVSYTEEELKYLKEFLEIKHISSYLCNCLTENGIQVSGLAIKSLYGILNENSSSATPAKYLNLYGYIVIASSIGGNAIVFSKNDEKVYWADHSYFYDDGISYEDKENGEWYDVEYSIENVNKALFVLEDSIDSFFKKLQTEELKVKIDEID